VPVTQEPSTHAEAARRGNGRIWLAVAVAAALLAAGGVYLLVRPTTFDAQGALRLQDPETIRARCAGQGGYVDIRIGAQVVVTDADEKTVGIGRLDASANKGLYCEYSFTVRDVPAGLDFYGVEVSKRSRVQYSEEQLRAGVTLSLGAG
jgi:hypothetical protein